MMASLVLVDVDYLDGGISCTVDVDFIIVTCVHVSQVTRGRRCVGNEDRKLGGVT